jgi:predicted DNA-binding WGR domain protein
LTSVFGLTPQAPKKGTTRKASKAIPAAGPKRKARGTPKPKIKVAQAGGRATPKKAAKAKSKGKSKGKSKTSAGSKRKPKQTEAELHEGEEEEEGQSAAFATPPRKKAKSSASSAADDDYGVMEPEAVYLECHTAGHNKFYRMTPMGSSVLCEWGSLKEGMPSSEKVRPFASPEAAAKFIQSVKAKELKKGYKVVKE